MITSQHCKCGRATACFGDYQQEDKPGDLIKRNFFSYAPVSPAILFPHLCHVDKTNNMII